MANEGLIRGTVLEAKENLLNDVSNAFDEGLYNDVTFVLADNVSVSTSKYMLACRVPFSSSMLFGGFAGTSEGSSVPGSSVPLKCCDSIVFKQVLNFVFKGEISFKDMNLQSVLNLLETSRFLGLDILKDGIIEYIQGLIFDENVDFKDCLEALEFTTNYKFTKVTVSLLSFIDKNLAAICSLPEFGNMSESNLKMVLGRKEEKVSSLIDRFTAFTKWLDLKKDESLSVDFKSEVLSVFELGDFDRKDLVKIVMRSNLFDNSDISKVLDEHLDELEESVEKWRESEEKWRKSVFIKCCKSISLNKKRVFKTEAPFPDTTFAHVEFFLSHDCDLCNKNFEEKCEDGCGYVYSYDFECSQDGKNWTKVASCIGRNCGLQKVDFEPRKIAFVAVKLTEGIHSESKDISNMADIEDLRLLIETM